MRTGDPGQEKALENCPVLLDWRVDQADDDLAAVRDGPRAQNQRGRGARGLDLGNLGPREGEILFDGADVAVLGQSGAGGVGGRAVFELEPVGAQGIQSANHACAQPFGEIVNGLLGARLERHHQFVGHGAFGLPLRLGLVRGLDPHGGAGLRVEKHVEARRTVVGRDQREVEAAQQPAQSVARLQVFEFGGDDMLGAWFDVDMPGCPGCDPLEDLLQRPAFDLRIDQIVACPPLDGPDERRVGRAA